MNHFLAHLGSCGFGIHSNRRSQLQDTIRKGRNDNNNNRSNRKFIDEKEIRKEEINFFVTSLLPQIPPQPYSYNYEVKDDKSNNYGQSEIVDNKGFVSGSYHVLLPDGRHQYVTYKDEGFGLVAEVTYKGESIFPEYKVPAYPSLAPTKKVASKKPSFAVPKNKPVDTKETTKETPKKTATVEAKPEAAVEPVYKKPVAPEVTVKKPDTKESPLSKLPFSEPIYRSSITTEAVPKAPVTAAPKASVTAAPKAPVTAAPKKEYAATTTSPWKPIYSTTAAYKAPLTTTTQKATTTTTTTTTTTPAYKAVVYTTTTYKPPVYTTTVHKEPVYIKNKEPAYSAPILYQEQVKKAPVYHSPPSYNKPATYVGPIYKGPAYKVMPVYKGPTYRMPVKGVNPAPAYQVQSYRAPAYKPAPAPSFSVPTYKAAKY